MGLGLASASPYAWAAAAITVWLLCLWTSRILPFDWHRLNSFVAFYLVWGCASTAAFFHYLQADKGFQGWADVYYFCGDRMQFCTCGGRWNAAGYAKAAVLWNFVLSAAFGLQQLIIQLGFRGLLPGEEVVTKESFISIGWRLIPYWLNNWEQNWGAECSSMMFELPHFAIELLVVLPIVQILCGRLRILPHLPGGQPLGLMHQPAHVRENPRLLRVLSPCLLRGVWRPRRGQHTLVGRLRANRRVIAMVALVSALAAFNALCMPLRLEAEVFADGRTRPLLRAAEEMKEARMGGAWQLRDLGPAGNAAQDALLLRNCSADALRGVMRKHVVDLRKMASPEHAALIPLIEAALTILRLSCERFFVSVTALAAYILFRMRCPPAARLAIALNHKLSLLLQRVILYAFPAICWAYNAGYAFSAFVSLVFWGGTARQLWNAARVQAVLVEVQGVRGASREQVEMMNGNCAVCWSSMAPVGHDAAGSAEEEAEQSEEEWQPGSSRDGGLDAAVSSAGQALPCGHAFHERCIRRWLAQCHGQGRRPSCPMCNAPMGLLVRYRMPLPWRVISPAAAAANEPAWTLPALYADFKLWLRNCVCANGHQLWGLRPPGGGATEEGAMLPLALDLNPAPELQD